MPATLLIELFCEELPPKSLRQLGEAFVKNVKALLKLRNFQIDDSNVTGYATPRRLAVSIANVPEQTMTAKSRIDLMPISIAFDANGKPTPALEKAIQRAKLGENYASVEKGGWEEVPHEKGPRLRYTKQPEPLSLAECLNDVVNESIQGLPIPKVMTYQTEDGKDVQFVRPVHGLVALHGATVMPVRALEIQADRVVHGHRFLGTKDIILKNADEYVHRLTSEGKVVPSFEGRRDDILNQLREAAAKGNGTLGPEAECLALLDEVTALVELPAVYVGAFEPEFLKIPPECLILTMRQNQKYFPLFDHSGKLTNRFLIVSNMRLDDPTNIVQGNERVVRPRLADARFFFETDRKVRLADRVPQLGAIVHHNKLGTQLERVERLRKLASRIQTMLPRGEKGRPYADRAALLAKADLVTLMVGEFPELQGVMGKYYAEADGEEPSVVRAVEQHYWPRFAGDALPTGDASIAVALADRLDALVGMFSIGQIPTGDKDPFALRRAALGIVRILMETPLKIELEPLIRAAAQTLPKIAPGAIESVISQVRDFVRERLANLLRERGYTAHEVAAVLEVEGAGSQPDRLDLIPMKLEAVREFGKLPEAQALAAANKRIQNILRKSPASEAGDYALLYEPEEKKLHQSLTAVIALVNLKFAAQDYTGTLKALATLRTDVDSFFDKVLVNTEDSKLRAARLNLLSDLDVTMNKVADISKLSS